MSHYANEFREATCYINRADFVEAAAKIRGACQTEEWVGYGWRDDLLDAYDLFDVGNIFNIGFEPVYGNYYRPVIKDVYVSRFFDTMIKVVAPYMTNGIMEIDDEYGTHIIEYLNGELIHTYKDHEEEM